jgi:hypothetical protein
VVDELEAAPIFETVDQAVTWATSVGPAPPAEGQPPDSGD